MSEFSKIMMDKCMNFSIRVVNLCHYLNEEKREFNISNQLFRSGTSIGANYAEAQNAISRKDFIAKVYISLKECNESLYWIELLHKTYFITQQQYESIYFDCEELKKILVSITKTSRENDALTS
jgi:conserved hypothetical protein TIGR02436